MTATVIPFPNARTSGYRVIEAPHPAFGWCPDCNPPKPSVTVMNLGRLHYGVCEFHRTKWLIGDNLFSGWREESPAFREQVADFLRGCRDVSDRVL